MRSFFLPGAFIVSAVRPAGQPLQSLSVHAEAGGSLLIPVGPFGAITLYANAERLVDANRTSCGGERCVLFTAIQDQRYNIGPCVYGGRCA